MSITTKVHSAQQISRTTTDDITVVATEEWGVIMDNDSANYGQQTFELNSDGSIISSGNWHVDGVDCPFQNASVIISDTIFSFTATGTATNPNPSIPAPYKTSPFTLNVTASAHNGISYATWSIIFSTQGWPPTVQGVSFATRKSGSGVTADDNTKPYDFTVDGIFYKRTSTVSPYTVEVTVETDKANSYSGDVTIPSSVTFNDINYSVTSIGAYAFAASTNLNSVSIPSSVTSIQPWAFVECSALTAPTIPSSVTLIDNGAFWGCTSITDITIPTLVDSIGLYAFYGCTGLPGISVDATNTTFSSEDGVLYNKDKTTLVVYPAGKPGTSYTISSSVDTIGGFAFGYCKGLTSITIPTSVTYITAAAFSECTGLTSMTIPSSVTYLNNNPFYNCTGLTAIYVDPSNLYNASVDGVLFKKNLETIIFYPPSKSGSSYTIPSSVTYIRSGVFRGCTGLKTISIPSSVTMIRSEVFSGCTGLTSLYAYPVIPVDLSSAEETSNDAFLGVDTMTCVLHVPVGSKDLYAAAIQWKSFVNIVDDAISGVITPSVSGVKVSVQNGQLQISGATVGETITVYSLQGATLYSQKADTETVVISLPVQGAYMVKVGAESVKVVY